MSTLSEQQQGEAYQKATSLLECATNLAPNLSSIPSLVSLRNLQTDPPTEDEPPFSIENHGHHALQRALEDLEKLESALVLEQDLVSQLTGAVVASPSCSLQALQTLGKSIPRRVCQHPFKRNDIVWVCRTCQADETCVLCHACYTQSCHDGHDVAFYHAQAGGCCDCGDPDAWDPQGFCPRHGPSSLASGEALDEAIVNRVRGIVPATVDWLVHTIASNAERAHERAKPSTTEDPNMSDDAMLLDLHVFVPEAASTSKSFHGSESNVSSSPDGPSLKEQVGTSGLEGQGLYLVLYGDDIHTKSQLMSALRQHFGGSSYYSDNLLTRLVQVLRQQGQLIVWGTMEVVGTCPQVQLWLDGDKVTLKKTGSAMLSKAAGLTGKGLVCSIVTRQELQLEQRAVAVLQWLTELARSCDPLCQTVAECILPEQHLEPMLKADFKLSASISKAWHSLLLTLLAVPTFKSHLAAAYCDTYRHVTAQYAAGMGVLERSGYTLSVQFLNRVTYVVDLVQHRNLLQKLGKALLETLQVAATGNDQVLDPQHFLLIHRRYSPCISDLKCVLNVKGMARLFCSGDFLGDWIASLTLGQGMDDVVWRRPAQGHVEVEPRGWVGAFNASISLASLFERLLNWNDADKPLIESYTDLPTCVELTCHVMTYGLAQWQWRQVSNYTPKSCGSEYSLCPASLPFCTIAARHGTLVAFAALPVSQITPWSFHFPLHRFVAACLREVCRRPADCMKELTEKLPSKLYGGFLEFPVLVLSRAAQVRAGLWRRNGGGMHDQVLNYAEPPFCRALRDADILLVQFASLHKNAVARMIHLLLHRFGLFDFLGLSKAPDANVEQYQREAAAGRYKLEQVDPDAPSYVEEYDLVLPWTYSPANDVAASVSLLEEFLHLLIVLVTELPPVPPKDKTEHTDQAKQRLRREVVHRLASGPKTHSELSEVHHVLSHWDNVFLSEEGKLLNPDDASGAALGVALEQVAERKTNRDKIGPDQWELSRNAWFDYDPAFYHISLRSHQGAAENRPKPALSSGLLGVQARPFCPSKQIPSHPVFQRLPRDVTADATVLAVCYRTLHVHCSNHSGESELSELKTSLAYHSDAMSETALARAVQLLTLGASAWQDARSDDTEWKAHGGGSMGSIFYKRIAPAPTARDWVALALMSQPNELMDSELYNGEENTLLLLRRLAVDGGKPGGFISQDRSLRSGAAWLCEFAAEHNAEASSLIGTKEASHADDSSVGSGKSELERRKQAAKARAMARMQAEAARFAEKMKIDSEDSNDGAKMPSDDQASGAGLEDILFSPRQQDPMSRSSTFSEHSVQSSSTAASRSPQRGDLGIPQFFSMYSPEGDVILDDSENDIPDRLLKDRPQCIICVDDGLMARDAETMSRSENEEGNRKRSRRKTGSNALAFVGYSQASTVLKGGGGPPPSLEDTSPLSAVRRFAGTHVTLCGHAVHSECCESYLSSVSHREDRTIGRRDEFRCPLCQRLSNCLVPFIDVGVDWAECPKTASVVASPSDDIASVTGTSDTGFAAKSSSLDDVSDPMLLDKPLQPRADLHSFLSTTPWWVARNDRSVVWDGQCAFISADTASEKDDSNQSEEMDIDDRSPKMSRKRSVRSLRKKDLYAAWNAMMRTPRFMRRKLRPKSSSLTDSAPGEENSIIAQWSPPEESSGETLVWRRLMDLLADTAFRADGKRLGEQYILQYCGEFRHCVVEKSAHNIMNREAGKQNVEWPACISQTSLPDSRRQELAREKLLSKLLVSVQAFTYSCCCESYEAKRLIGRDRRPDANDLQSLYSKYGIRGVSCDGRLVLMPTPSTRDSDGTQPFNGRLGKLRYFGLAVMAAAGAVSADLVQLVLCFPLNKQEPATVVPNDPLTTFFNSADARAPVVFPMLLGHVLTHVVAAMCATCGRARARSDSLELAWPAPFSKRGSFCSPFQEDESPTTSAVVDCKGFINLGVLARMLQILLNKMEIQAEAKDGRSEASILLGLRRIVENDARDTAEAKWSRACFSLLEMALSKETFSDIPFENDLRSRDNNLRDQFYDACSVAASELVSFLSDVGIIFQILAPGVVVTFDDDQQAGKSNDGDLDLPRMLETLQQLQHCLGLESIDRLLQSSLVAEVILNWYETARSHARNSVTEETAVFHSSRVRSRLFRTEGFRSFDWPMETLESQLGTSLQKKPHSFPGSVSAGFAHSQSYSTTPPVVLDSFPTTVAELNPESPGPLVAFSSKKSVHLIGGYLVPENDHSDIHSRPRVATLATSYTDLYATLGTLCPDSDQTALCLICGEILNAGGKSECTKHSYKCGAGSCIFFLLQECVALIMHGDKAAYVHSPYVDSHGETPQYRGRPLNLDIDRYNLLEEMWKGHTVRERVVAERGSARQVIIADFY